MCTTGLEEMNFWWIKIDALAWSYNWTLGIFNAVTDTHMMQVQN